MPAPVLKSLADEAGKPMKDAERYWSDAIETAKGKGFKENTDRFFAYVTGIVKRRLGLASDSNMCKIAKYLSGGSLKDKDIIADQLINAWEHSDEQEMYEHLVENTHVDNKKLKQLVDDWYKNNRRRNNVQMFKEDIDDWIDEYLHLPKRKQPNLLLK